MKLTSSRRVPLFYQFVGMVLLPLQVFASGPGPILLLGSSTAATTAGFTPPPPAKVKDNRAPRKLNVVKPNLNLTASPTDTQIELARVFQEPLFPNGSSSGSEENRALAAALADYYKTRSVDTLTSYVTQHPQSRWLGSLDYNIGQIHYQTGYLSLAISDWQTSWDLLKSAKSLSLHAIADRAIGELVVLDAELGRTSELKRLFAEIGNRPLLGTGSERVQEAKEGYQIMKTHPSIAFKCGPFALDSIRTADKNRHPRSAIIEGAMSTDHGTSLAMVKDWSDKLHMNYQMAKRAPGASLIVPSVMHWKLGHFAALVREKKKKYLIQDPTFGGAELWVAADALEAETSGYFLVPAGPLPAGWKSVDKAEASKVWGRGGSKAKDPTKKGCTGCTGGMAVASVYPMTCTLHIQDKPVVYTAPVGPQVNLIVGYNYQETNQPSNLPFSNFGYDWVFEYTSYLTVDASNNVTIALPGGGSEVYDYSTFDDINNVFAPDIESQAQLYITNVGNYERRMPDGSKYVYSQPDGSGRVFMTQVVDPQGNSLILNYDSNFRLISVQDQIGQQTTFSYLSNAAGTSGFYKIASITDPFGRSAQFQYDATGTQLTKITDVVGITSQFTYDSSYFIDSMTTPYGKTLFNQYAVASDPTGLAVGLRVTLPDGTQDITENWMNHELNTYHWTRKQSPFYPDKTKARLTHWLQEAGSNLESRIISYTKEPLEGGSNLATGISIGTSGTVAPPGSVVYSYPNSYSVTPTAGSIDPSTGLPVPLSDAVVHSYVGTSNQPTSVSRLLDDGTTQTSYYTTNSFGHVTSFLDPIGRSYAFYYDANGVDLLEVRQVKGGANDLIGKLIYNSQHEPLTYIDGSGQQTSYGYNTEGQIVTLTDAKHNTTTYNYGSNGYLLSIDGPLVGTNDKTTFTYDGYGRVYTVSDSEGYTLTFGYDNLDRITSVTYPDGTFEQVIWNRLDPGFLRDRLGNWTEQQFDSVRQLAAVTDSDGRSTLYHWCTCGALGSITDGAGHVTQWMRDLQGRTVQKIYPDGTANNYGYGGQPWNTTTPGNTSRLTSITDALNRTKTYTYFADDTVSQIAYSEGTPTRSYTYDSSYQRLLSAGVVGGPTYTYAYYNYVTDPYAAPVTGAGSLQSITNSLLGSTATVSYSYDELGRITNRSIGSNNSITTGYDAMSRVTSVLNPLGSFGYQYVDDINTAGPGNDKGTTRLSQINYPNGQVTKYSYLPTANDERLAQINNLNSASTVISQFNYGYDAKGQITSWQQQIDSNTPNSYAIGYDAAGQLNSAVLSNSSNAVLHQYYYHYDAAANRTSEQVDTSVTQTSVNNLNQITGQSAGGSTRFQGIVSKPGTVTVAVNGQPAQPAQMPTSTNFVANPSLTMTSQNGGTNTVTVVATDGSGNATTNNYQVVVPTQTSATPAYDAAGNMTNNGRGQTYQWDAENRLIQIVQGSDTYQFTYDGLGRRVSETDNSALTKQWLWVGANLAEERDGSNNITKRFYAQGEQISDSPFYYTRDHLGSVREMTDAAGNIQARYDYDPYGRVTPESGSMTSDFQYAGYYEHSGSGLNLTLFRAYDPNTAKFLSRDPAGESASINLYDYVDNSPLDGIDPLGLWEITVTLGDGVAGQINFGYNDGHANFGFTAGVGAGFGYSYDGDNDCENNDWDAGFKAEADVDVPGVGSVGSELAYNSSENIYMQDPEQSVSYGSSLNINPLSLKGFPTLTKSAEIKTDLDTGTTCNSTSSSADGDLSKEEKAKGKSEKPSADGIVGVHFNAPIF